MLRADLLQRHRQEDDDVDEAADEEEAAGAPAHEAARVRGVHVVAHGLEGPRAVSASDSIREPRTIKERRDGARTMLSMQEAAPPPLLGAAPKDTSFKQLESSK